MAKKKLNFKVTLDGMYSGIELTEREVDHVYNIFGTLREAKKEIIDNHKSLLRAYKENMQYVRELTINELKTNYENS